MDEANTMRAGAPSDRRGAADDLPVFPPTVGGKTGARPVAYRLDRDGRIVWANDAWSEFAVANGAPELCEFEGRSVVDAIADPGTRDLWQRLCDAVTVTGCSITVPYRCDSPSEHRRYVAEIHPLSSGHVELRHVPVQTWPRSSPGGSPEPVPGMSWRVCSWCLRVNVGDDWYDVHGIDASGAGLSHGVCPDCARTVLAAFPRGTDRPGPSAR